MSLQLNLNFGPLNEVLSPVLYTVELDPMSPVVGQILGPLTLVFSKHGRHSLPITSELAFEVQKAFLTDSHVRYQPDSTRKPPELLKQLIVYPRAVEIDRWIRSRLVLVCNPRGDVLARIPTLVSILLTIGWPRTPLFMRVGKHSRR